MPSKKPKFFTNLEAACDDKTPGHLMVIAISHQMPDPIADLKSYVINLDLNTQPAKYEIIVNGGKQMFPVYPSCFSCIGRDSENTIFVGEDDGFIRYKNGIAEIVKHRPKVGITNCCYVRGADDIVFGTSGGNIVYVNSQKLEVIKIVSSSKINSSECNVSAIHGIGPNYMVAVGESGLVSCFRNGAWERIKPPSNVYMRSVWCRNETEIYVGSKRGQVWCWDGGSRWRKLKVNAEQANISFTFAYLAEYQDVLYAACVEHGVYRLDGDTWVPIPKVKNEDVCFLKATSSGLIGLGALWGESGSWLTRFDGKTWTAQQIRVDPV